MAFTATASTNIGRQCQTLHQRLHIVPLLGEEP
jgi:hypothetical protein